MRKYYLTHEEKTEIFMHAKTGENPIFGFSKTN